MGLIAPDSMKITGKLINPVYRGASPATRDHIHDKIASGWDVLAVADWVERKSLAKIDMFMSHNLRTTKGFDYAADAVGGPPGYSGQATGSSSTTLTDSGATWTVNQWAGYRAFAALAASIVVGTVLSNTSTALTVDGWKVIGSGVTGSTPGSTAVYAISGRAAARYVAYSTDTGAPSAGDTTLTSEVSSNGITRTLGTYSHTAGTSTYQIAAAMTASGNVSALAKIGIFDALANGILAQEIRLTDVSLTVISVSATDVTTPGVLVTLS